MIKHIIEGLNDLYETKDPFELCECLNIKNLGSEIKGFFQKTPNSFEIIHLNTNLTREEEKYISAHELGHALLHTDMSLQFFIDNKLQIKNKYEIQADKFAAELLIENTLHKTEYDGLNIEQISSKLYVPVKLLKYKFNLSG
ncbi:ImmA/IrrE family metallo-endopeptidase [Clostridium sporogenes]|uniref:ImmA/IrrE family metallo-endopeptidase n=1 Tax=Clostridium sporogenes TaxID=1509 RepID=UPI000668114D|nr:ImmA/IrrE family metallo-endopeptidase [Clostridium sporogenes]